MKYIICINNTQREEHLTIGKVYKVQYVTKTHYEIRNNNGKVRDYYKDRFKKLIGDYDT